MTDGRVGWGEALPREYVTGETIESVVADIAATFWPRYLLDGSVAPVDASGAGSTNAAACALELAHLDATGAFAGLPMAEMIRARVSGVLGSADPRKTSRRLALMRLFGLRDFKLKLGFGDRIDAENLHVVTAKIGRAIAAGRCSLRVDVNGGWDADSTSHRVAEMKAHGVCAVEQPTFCDADGLLAVARRCELPLIADESLLTTADAQCLLAEPQRVWWNIRISKNGGCMPALEMARLAEANGVNFVIGCMVGESSILSAAQRRLLQLAGPPRFVEGNYGRFLLRGDLTRPSLRFGYGGSLKAIDSPGLGVRTSRAALKRFAHRVMTLRDN